MKKIFFLIISFFLVVMPFFASAEGLVPCGGQDQPKCEFCHLFVLIDKIVDFVLFKIVPWIALFVVITGGINLYFSMGNPQKRNDAVKKLIAAGVGMLIVYGSWFWSMSFLLLLELANGPALELGLNTLVIREAKIQITNIKFLCSRFNLEHFLMKIYQCGF